MFIKFNIFKGGMHGTTPNDVHGKKRRMDWDPLDLNSNADIGSSDPKTPNLACGKERRKNNGNSSKYLKERFYSKVQGIHNRHKKGF